MVNEKKAEHAKLWKDKHIVDYLRCSAGLAILYLDKHTKDGGSS